MTTSNRKFTILVVDNDDRVHNRAHAELAEFGREVAIINATDVDAAAAAMTTAFVDIAFVDLSLRRQLGVTVIHELAARSPHAKILVITKYMDRLERDEVGDLLAPGSNISGIINKARDDARWFQPVVQVELDRWRQRQVALDGLEGTDGIVSKVVEKRSRIQADLEKRGRPYRLTLRQSSSAVRDELRALFDSVYGDALSAFGVVRPTLRVQPMRSGYSSSIIFSATPAYLISGSQTTVEGVTSIVKIGPRPEIEAEVDRYRKIVQHGLPTRSRVEMLGCAFADALGMIAYTFASERPGSIMTLDDWLRKGPSAASAMEMMNHVVSTTIAEWPQVSQRSTSLLEYMKAEKAAPPNSSLQTLDHWLAELESRDEWLSFNSTQDARTRLLRGGRASLTLPRTPLLASVELREPTPSTFQHGDLHGGNIVLDTLTKPARCRVIDYRNAGMGPRYLDYASLQASIRLSEAASSRRQLACERFDAEHFEMIVSRYQLAETVGEDGLLAASASRPPWWVAASNAVGAAALQKADQPARTEYLWTQFAYCLHLFTISSLQDYERVRLLVWLSALTRAIVDPVTDTRRRSPRR